MPTKYLILKPIPCNIADLAFASEKDLWEEHKNLTETFLKTWKGIRSGEIDIPSALSGRKQISLMDLNVELTKRMLTHCNFCRWDCQFDRRPIQTGGYYIGINKHETCQLESTSKVSRYFHHSGEELIFRGNMGSNNILHKL